MKVNFKIDGKQVYATKNGVKVSSRGKIERNAGVVLGQLATRRERRQLRKALHVAGFAGFASAVVVPRGWDVAETSLADAA